MIDEELAPAIDQASGSDADRTRRPLDPAGVSIVTAGCSMAAIVAREGSPGWTLFRVGIVAAVTTAAVVAVTTGRLRSIACTAIGTVAIVTGLGIGVVHLVRSGDVVLTVAGLVALVSGLVLTVLGVVGAVRGHRGWVQACCIGGAVTVIALAVLTFVPAVMATNFPRPDLGTDTPADHGLAYRDVEFTTDDGVDLAGWYVPSSNGAAVVLRHGSGSTRTDVLAHAEAIARGGFGVLLTDARGHGESEGRAMDFGWFGDADTTAAVTFLTEQPDVDPDRIGVVGMSMGGEEAIGAAAADARIRAVVAEGATGRTTVDSDWLSDVYGLRGSLQERIEWLRFGLADGLTSAHEPIGLADAVRAAPSTAFLLIAGGDVADERHTLDHIAESAPANLTTWIVPDAGHTQGLDRRPTEWSTRVGTFLADELAP